MISHISFRWGLQWESCWICAWYTNLCRKLLEACGPLIY